MNSVQEQEPWPHEPFRALPGPSYGLKVLREELGKQTFGTLPTSVLFGFILDLSSMICFCLKKKKKQVPQLGMVICAQ